MTSSHVGEADVRKSCEVHLPSEEKLFCSGYARLINQKADATDFSNFCVAEYRRMALLAKPSPVSSPVPSSVPTAHVQQPKKAANMPALCTQLFQNVNTATLTGDALKRAASELCTQEP